MPLGLPVPSGQRVREALRGDLGEVTIYFRDAREPAFLHRGDVAAALIPVYG